MKSGSEYRNKPNKFVERSKDAGKIAAALAVVAGLGYGATKVWDFAMFIRGGDGPNVPVKTAVNEAKTDYNNSFLRSSAAGKFIIEYLRKTDIEIHEYPKNHGLNGGSVANEVWGVHFNNGCLFNTAYDISGGRINATVEGLFTYANISGNSPAAAAYAQINPSNPNQLIIESGHSNSVNLVFDGLQTGTTLTPDNNQTENILKTYGCQTGMTNVTNYWN